MSKIDVILIGKKAADFFNHLNGEDKNPIHRIGIDHIAIDSKFTIWLPHKSHFKFSNTKNSIIALCPSNESEARLLLNYKKEIQSVLIYEKDEILKNVPEEVMRFHYPESGKEKELFEDIYHKLFTNKIPALESPPALDKKASFFDRLKKLPSMTRTQSETKETKTDERKLVRVKSF